MKKSTVSLLLIFIFLIPISMKSLCGVIDADVKQRKTPVDPPSTPVIPDKKTKPNRCNKKVAAGGGVGAGALVTILTANYFLGGAAPTNEFSMELNGTDPSHEDLEKTTGLLCKKAINTKFNPCRRAPDCNYFCPKDLRNSKDCNSFCNAPVTAEDKCKADCECIGTVNTDRQTTKISCQPNPEKIITIAGIAAGTSIAYTPPKGIDNPKNPKQNSMNKIFDKRPPASSGKKGR